MSGMLIDDDSMAIIIARLRSDMSVTNWYGESTTAAATTQKEVSIPSITTLNTGQVIVVKPTKTSTVANSTLKLNNFDAYPMKYNNADITTSSDSIVWNANYPSQFLFNGSYWVFLGHGIDSNTTYSAMSVEEGTSGTATSSRTMRADYLKQIIEALVPLAETDPIFTASAAHGITSTNISNWNGKQSPQTTLSGYGITDAKIENGTITLGSNTITPITSHQDISGKVDLSGGQMSGELTAYSQDSPNNAQVRNIHISTSEPTSADGNDGDIWIVYNI